MGMSVDPDPECYEGINGFISLIGMQPRACMMVLLTQSCEQLAKRWEAEELS